MWHGTGLAAVTSLQVRLVIPIQCTIFCHRNWSTYPNDTHLTTIPDQDSMYIALIRYMHALWNNTGTMHMLALCACSELLSVGSLENGCRAYAGVRRQIHLPPNNIVFEHSSMCS